MPTQEKAAKAAIIAHLYHAYALDVKTLDRLSLGADFNTSVYRARAKDGIDYFVKLRSGPFLEASVAVPKYLSDLGIQQVIPSIVTKIEQLWSHLHTPSQSFKIILYRYIEGPNAAEAKLSKEQWMQFGTAIRKLHTTHFPDAIAKDIPRESFSSKWRDTLRSYSIGIANATFEDPIARQTATFLKSKSVQILKMIEYLDHLVPSLNNQQLSYVLCHADLHGWNLITHQKNDLFIVDWDTLVFAPRERDLMFMGAGIWDSGLTPNEEETLFYAGYGEKEINRDAIGYYRCERIVQDICEYCEHIFLSNATYDERLQSLNHLQSNFRPNGPLERALRYLTQQ